MNAGYTQRAGRRARLAAILLSAALLAGCGNVTAGGADGEVEVYGASDAPEPAPASGVARQDFAAAPPVETPPNGAAIIGILEGDMTVDMDVFVRAVDGVEHRVTPSGGKRLTLDLDDGEASAGRQRVPAGAYQELRLVIADASADVLGGLVIDTLPFIGAVDVLIGPAGFDVVLPIAFEVREDELVDLRLDFNARQWLLTLELDLLDILPPLRATVTAQAFGDALEVSLR